MRPIFQALGQRQCLRMPTAEDQCPGMGQSQPGVTCQPWFGYLFQLAQQPAATATLQQCITAPGQLPGRLLPMAGPDQLVDSRQRLPGCK
ncbi:hypothetical protein D3C76_1014930 [compost metagenome]